LIYAVDNFQAFSLEFLAKCHREIVVHVVFLLSENFVVCLLTTKLSMTWLKEEAFLEVGFLLLLFEVVGSTCLWKICMFSWLVPIHCCSLCSWINGKHWVLMLRPQLCLHCFRLELGLFAFCSQQMLVFCHHERVFSVGRWKTYFVRLFVSWKLVHASCSKGYLRNNWLNLTLSILKHT
jgi:hypothetical protein